jgi:cation:H+ antiporter
LSVLAWFRASGCGHRGDVSYLLLALAFALLLGGAVVFTNAIEWAGERLHLGSGAVGSVLAAVATALPESVIPVIAIVSGDESGEIAIGAIIGAPFLLATLAMLLVGLSTHAWSGRRDQNADLDIDVTTTVRDLVVFLVFFSLAGALGFIDNDTVKIAAAIVFVLAYAVYVWRTLRHGGEADEDPKPLYFDVHRSDSPPTWAVVVQLVVGIGMIVGGAELFVREIESIALAAGISPLVLALVLSPLATELPEKVNSVIWSRRGQDALALGNISGAMVFQSMIPVAVGLAFTPWAFTTPSTLATACALAGGIVALFSVLKLGRFRWPEMVIWGGLYGGFVGYMAVYG